MEKAADKPIVIHKPVPGANFRYERKFIFINDYLEDLVEQLYLNSFCFSEIFEKRRVNNVYFDDNELNFYKQNVSGVGTREKYRLRWYGDNFAEIRNPAIEIKRKFGEVGDKLTYKLPGLSYNLDAGNATELQQLVLQQLGDHPGLKNTLNQFNPTLFNTYERRYFLSACERYRVTLDFYQAFYDPALANFRESKKKINESIVVLELKYTTEHDMEARNIPQQFSARVSRNSKYVQGIDLIKGRTLF